MTLKEYRYSTARDYTGPKAIKSLIRKGMIEVCPCCNGLNCYSPLDINDTYAIVRIPHSSCFEWSCGHCNTSFAEASSPILAECYTHMPAMAEGED